MKKYILFLFIFTLVFSLLGFTNSASAQMAAINRGSSGGGSGSSSTRSLPAGCTSTRGYSPLTGVKCDTVINSSLPSGCTSTAGYSPLTGVKCDSLVSTNFPAGCTSNSGYSITTGLPCGNSSNFPPGCASNTGFSSTTGRSCEEGTNNNPVISGVSGPQTLNVNQQGTWSVRASSPNGGELMYSVLWGDEATNIQAGSNSQVLNIPTQSATFQHSYVKSGIFTPRFTVQNAVGQTAQTSLSVNVGNTTQPSITSLGTNNALPGEKVAMYMFDLHSAYSYTVTFAGKTLSGDTDASIVGTYLSFTVPNFPPGLYSLTAQGRNSNGSLAFNTQNSISFTIGTPSTQPSITVTSPNERVTWVRGTTKTLSWNDTNNISTHEVELISTGSVYVIANTQGSSYNWTVGNYLSGIVPDGVYTVKVCQSSSDTCGLSNSTITITSGTNTQTPYITGSAELVSASEDHPIKWNTSIGGRIHGPDWKWAVKINNSGSSAKTIKRMVLVHNTSGEGWATDASSNNPVGKYLYILGWTTSQSCGVNCEPNATQTDNIGWQIPAYGGLSFYAYGYPGSQRFAGGYLLLNFTDNTSARISIPASNIVPRGTVSTSPSITVVSPTSGENLVVGQPYQITWLDPNISNINDSFSIAYVTSGGNRTIVSSISAGQLQGTGSRCDATYACRYSWTPDTAMTNTQIIISDIPHGIVSRSGVFTITSPTTSTLSCSTLQQTQQGYYNSCKNQGFENVCFSKSGVYQGCTNNARNDCTLNNVNASSNVLCSVGATQPTIITSTSEGGTISPSGHITVPAGSNKTFTFTPNVGYKVSTITLDNNSTVPVASSYTFYNVTGSHIIGVSFSPVSTTQPSITVTSPNGGTFSSTDVIGIDFTPSGLVGKQANVFLLNTDTNLNYQVSTAIQLSTSRITLATPMPHLIPAGNHYKLRIEAFDTVTGSGVLAIGLSNNYFTITSPTTVSSCTDSDDGRNPNVAGLADGRVNGLGSYFRDVSVASNGGVCSGDSCTSVAEGYCADDGKVSNILMSCSTEYSVNGACANKTVTNSLDLKSISWMTSISSGDIYYNPRVNFGNGDLLPFNDTGTATKWCQAVPGKVYTSGTSKVQGDNPTTGDHYRFDGSQWVNVGVGDYPRLYTCSSGSTTRNLSSSLVATAINGTANTDGNVSNAGSFHFTQFLEEGSYGNEVRELQKFLNGAGYDAGNVDGNFGAKVKEAVIKFQTDNGLKSDGIVGYEVRSLLNR
ncbi:MAG: peptidoglycan-binding domain-containing protein [Candidatus Paceibacterota bacterium]|jgi:hypothetical protein